MSITIKEIAQMAGVHRSTVDKVLHHRIGVSDEVRKQVQQIIDEAGYIPNPTGRALQKQGKTFHIEAILVNVDALPYLQDGIAQGAASMEGFHIQISSHVSAFQDIDTQVTYLKQAIKNQADGIVLSPTHSQQVRAAIKQATACGIPVVTINSDMEQSGRMCYVGQNGLQASRIAGRLIGQLLGGHGQAGIITSSIESENNNFYVQIREQGFCAFVEKHYPEIEIVQRVESFEDKKITYQKTVQLLKDYPDLRGLYITCGGAAEVGRALIEQSKAQEIKVVAFEDYPEILQLMQQNVIDCTLASDLREQGAQGLRLLMNRLIFGSIPASAQQFTETQILVRESIFPDE